MVVDDNTSSSCAPKQLKTVFLASVRACETFPIPILLQRLHLANKQLHSAALYRSDYLINVCVFSPIYFEVGLYEVLLCSEYFLQ